MTFADQCRLSLFDLRSLWIDKILMIVQIHVSGPIRFLHQLQLFGGDGGALTLLHGSAGEGA